MNGTQVRTEEMAKPRRRISKRRQSVVATQPMAKPKTELTKICQFGDALIAIGDLDPAYIALVGAKLPEPQQCRLLLAYALYDLGFAAWLCWSSPETRGRRCWAGADCRHSRRLF